MQEIAQAEVTGEVDHLGGVSFRLGAGILSDVKVPDAEIQGVKIEANPVAVVVVAADQTVDTKGVTAEVVDTVVLLGHGADLAVAAGDRSCGRHAVFPIEADQVIVDDLSVVVVQTARE